jgi:hypothetical protein
MREEQLDEKFAGITGRADDTYFHGTGTIARAAAGGEKVFAGG